jgi:hypothetical protein
MTVLLDVEVPAACSGGYEEENRRQSDAARSAVGRITIGTMGDSVKRHCREAAYLNKRMHLTAASGACGSLGPLARGGR